MGHLFVHQRRDGHGDGEVRLSGTGGADADDEVVTFDGFESSGAG
jgi:hypothetical protein